MQMLLLFGSYSSNVAVVTFQNVIVICFLFVYLHVLWETRRRAAAPPMSSLLSTLVDVYLLKGHEVYGIYALNLTGKK